jgi:diguanylate cyclase (GGDEF)-like protein
MAAQAGRTITPLSVILFDLDHFKAINETFGHERGDDALAAVGELLQTDVRASDYAGRYGGEEFLVLLPDTGREGALVLAEKLRRAVENIMLPGMEGKISASFGVASLPTDVGDGDALVRLADRALLAAKTAGRNRVEAAGLSVAPGPDQ